MNFVLITKSGRVMMFYVETCAIMFQQAFGGTIVSASAFSEEVYMVTK